MVKPGLVGEGGFPKPDKHYGDYPEPESPKRPLGAQLSSKVTWRVTVTYLVKAETARKAIDKWKSGNQVKMITELEPEYA